VPDILIFAVVTDVNTGDKIIFYLSQEKPWSYSQATRMFDARGPFKEFDRVGLGNQLQDAWRFRLFEDLIFYCRLMPLILVLLIIFFNLLMRKKFL
jgi:hypothetical protein